MRWRVFLLLIGAVLVGDSVAEACSRRGCGLFGLRCRFRNVQRVQKVQRVKVRDHYRDRGDTVALQVIYPQALIEPGRSAFGYSRSRYSASEFAPLDPNHVATLYARIAQSGVQGLHDTRSEGLTYNTTLAASLGDVARVQAATEHLRAAGGGQASASSSSTSSVEAELRLDSEGRVEMRHGLGQRPGQGNSGSVLARHCAECHGADTAQPAGGLYLHPQATLTPELAYRAIKAAETGRMPKDRADLSESQQKALRQELFALVN